MMYSPSPQTVTNLCVSYQYRDDGRRNDTTNRPFGECWRVCAKTSVFPSSRDGIDSCWPSGTESSASQRQRNQKCMVRRRTRSSLERSGENLGVSSVDDLPRDVHTDGGLLSTELYKESAIDATHDTKCDTLTTTAPSSNPNATSFPFLA